MIASRLRAATDCPRTSLPASNMQGVVAEESICLREATPVLELAFVHDAQRYRIQPSPSGRAAIRPAIGRFLNAAGDRRSKENGPLRPIRGRELSPR
jgi:hypothetical protein